MHRPCDSISHIKSRTNEPQMRNKSGLVRWNMRGIKSPPGRTDMTVKIDKESLSRDCAETLRTPSVKQLVVNSGCRETL